MGKICIKKKAGEPEAMGIMGVWPGETGHQITDTTFYMDMTAR